MQQNFLFGNYEGLRQHLHQTSVAFVPGRRLAGWRRSPGSATAKFVAGVTD